MHMRCGTTVPRPDWLTPDTSGPWSVEAFEVSKEDAKWQSVRAAFHSGRGVIRPGRYWALKRHGSLIMSDTPDELRDHFEPVWKAQGHCLVAGLGLGIIVNAVLVRPEVTRCTVVEYSPDVLALVGPALRERHGARLELVHADIFAYQPPKGLRYGMAWFDIWDSLCGDNLPEMTRLKRRYGRRVDWQGCWGEALLRYRARQEKRQAWRWS